MAVGEGKGRQPWLEGPSLAVWETGGRSLGCSFQLCIEGGVILVLLSSE